MIEHVFYLTMPTDLRDTAVLSPLEVLQVRSLDRVRAGLVADAKGWAARIAEITDLALRAEMAGPQTRRTLALELAGSWHVSQLTAEQWVAQAQRFVEALPLALSMLDAGTLLVHQAQVLLHRTWECTPEIAAKVEAEVLPDGAGLCPSDLARKVDRVRLRLESEAADAADAERQEAQKVAGRRTWLRPTPDGMAVAGALLTPEQAVAWAKGMDLLERRERLADRACGIRRTAEQRRADLFATLPALVLAGTAQDRCAGAVTRDSLSGPPGATASDGPEGEPTEPVDDAPLRPWTFHPDQVAAQIVVNVHVPCSTVLDLSHEPGTLDTYGPLSATRARLIRPTRYRRIMIDGGTGRPIAIDDTPVPAADTAEGRRQHVQDMLRPDVITDPDEPQHDPSARLARLIDLRDVRCCGPGCSSTRCDRDHLEPYPTGPTSAGNLGLASPRCHSAKHHGWTLHRHPDGSVTWNSPLHRNYDRPGPWESPPHIDLFDPPPLRRSSPITPARDQDQDEPPDLLDRLRRDNPDPPAATANGWSDDPQF